MDSDFIFGQKGYNLYRFYLGSDSSYQINDTLLTGSVFEDFDINACSAYQFNSGFVSNDAKKLTLDPFTSNGRLIPTSFALLQTLPNSTNERRGDPLCGSLYQPRGLQGE